WPSPSEHNAPSGAGGSLDAELIAFGVQQDDPVLYRFPLGTGGLVPDLLLDRPQPQKAIDLLVDLRFAGFRRPRGPAADVQVQVEAILARLRRVHQLKPNPRSPTLRIDDCARGMPFLLRDVPCFQGRFPCRESGRRVLHLVVEGLGPELREMIRIRRVEYNLSLRSQLNPRSEEDGMLFRQTAADRKIGRASCRERVEVSVVGVALV